MSGPLYSYTTALPETVRVCVSIATLLLEVASYLSPPPSSDGAQIPDHGVSGSELVPRSSLKEAQGLHRKSALIRQGHQHAPTSPSHRPRRRSSARRSPLLAQGVS